MARGLARSQGEYRARLAACDQLRRNDLDGRGHLSEEALVAFVTYFLTVCIDQVGFMESLVRPDRLSKRIVAWLQQEALQYRLPANAGTLVEALLYRGTLPRGDVGRLLGVGERQARRITSALLNRGVFNSETSRTPLRLAFPAALAQHWLPGLFQRARWIGSILERKHRGVRTSSSHATI